MVWWYDVIVSAAIEQEKQKIRKSVNKYDSMKQKIIVLIQAQANALPYLTL